MTERATDITTPYSAYHHREVPREDEELTHVGPDTPGGEYLRRFWQPVAMTQELADLPLPVRILGEDLVAFRDGRGRIGLLQRHCSHRAASLEFGVVSECGLRCCYHGWLYDVDGRILETPGEPPDSRLKERFYHGAYPVHEYKGLVFAYLGPPDKKPPFPILDTFDQPGDRLVPYSITYDCNWVQTSENSMDPAHVVFLHTRISFAQFSEAWGAMPDMDFKETPRGMMYFTTRRVEDHVWVRSNEGILPNITLVSGTWVDGTQESVFTRLSATRWRVAIDDTHTMMIGWRHFDESVDPSGKGVEEEVGKEKMDAFGQAGGRTYEDRQRTPGDYEACVSQRPIAVHALEHLATTDRGVRMLRNLIRKGIREVAAGGDPTSGMTGDGVNFTLAHDTIVHIPPKPDKDDRELLEEIANEVSRIVEESAGRAPAERKAFVQEHVEGLKQRL